MALRSASRASSASASSGSSLDPALTEGPAKTFETAQGKPDLKDVAELIKSGKAKKIVVMVGAGISTTAGIPDFRSPGTGLYANLQKYALPYPEAIFSINYFVRHPEAFFALAKELYPGNFKPTLAHYFFALLHLKGILLKCFSQNIDTLERLAGLPPAAVVEAHGSFANATCFLCKRTMTADELRPAIDQGQVVRCDRECCRGKPQALIKPDIVFFGEALPAAFFSSLSLLPKADLLLVLGTSLQVQPFASLINHVSPGCPRVLINLERVGEMEEPDGSTGGNSHRAEGFDFEGWATAGPEFARDVYFEGTADDGATQLAEALGWKEELLDLYTKGRENLEKTVKSTASAPLGDPDPGTNTSRAAERLGEAATGEEEHRTGEDDADVQAEGLAEQIDNIQLQDEGNVLTAEENTK